MSFRTDSEDFPDLQDRLAAEVDFLIQEQRSKVGIAISNRNNGKKKAPLAEPPVKLTPSWEAKNLPKDQLNFSNITMEKAQLETHPPKDRYNIVYIIILVHGIGILLPWNMFINAKSYFVDYKFNSTMNYSDTSEYVTNFLSYIGIASNIPNTVFNWLNIFVSLKGDISKRILYSIVIEVVIVVVTIALAMMQFTFDYPGVFFWITMSSVVVINVANAIWQNTIYGLAAKLPEAYTGAIVLGNNISGTFVAGVSILSMYAATTSKLSAIYYFITALFFLLICFDTYFLLPLTKYYRYRIYISEKQQLEAEANRKSVSEHIPYWRIFKKCSLQCFNAFYIFLITLLLFPTVVSDVKPRDPNFIISQKYFTPVTCFLTFNFAAMIGNIVAHFVLWPKPKYLFVPILLRTAFIPLLLMCNYHPAGVERLMSVRIHDDYVYWLIAFLFAFTSGYYSSCAMIYCPRTVEPHYMHIAGMFGAASLVTGILVGATLSMICPELVRIISW